jgi:NAD(P)-dependent dehydrogenase (short-subunit alcohol dehydrogenase family)
MAERLAGKVGIVTGAGQGIGRGIARRLASEGCSIIVAERNQETGARTATELTDELKAPTRFVATDVTDVAQVHRMVDAALEAFGAIDILVNNAFGEVTFERMERKRDDELELAFLTGPLATFRAMNAVFPHMREQRSGRIINLTSLSGINAHPFTADYNVAKESIRALTRTAAREWGRHNILVNAIAPSAASPQFIAFGEADPETMAAVLAQYPLGRQGDPEHDIGGVALFLATEDSDYVTGNTIFADGGIHINGVQFVPPMPD